MLILKWSTSWSMNWCLSDRVDQLLNPALRYMHGLIACSPGHTSTKTLRCSHTIYRMKEAVLCERMTYYVVLFTRLIPQKIKSVMLYFQENVWLLSRNFHWHLFICFLYFMLFLLAYTCLSSWNSWITEIFILGGWKGLGVGVIIQIDGREGYADM